MSEFLKSGEKRFSILCQSESRPGTRSDEMSSQRSFSALVVGEKTFEEPCDQGRSILTEFISILYSNQERKCLVCRKNMRTGRQANLTLWVTDCVCAGQLQRMLRLFFNWQVGFFGSMTRLHLMIP